MRSRDVGVTQVEETLVKPHARSCSQSHKCNPTTGRESTAGNWLICFDVFRAGGLFSSGRLKMCNEETLKDSEGIWQQHSLLDILLLNPKLRKTGVVFLVG